MGFKWLDDIKVGSNPINDTHTFDSSIDTIKSADSGINSINEAMATLNFSQIGDEIVVEGKRWRDIEQDLRQGQVRKVFEELNVTNTITSSEEAQLKTTLKANSPDIDISDLHIKQAEAKKYHSDLDVEASSGTELESKLDDSSKKKCESWYSKLTVGVTVGTTIVGVFGFMVFTGAMYDDIAKANNNRNGCFLAYMNTGVTTCKILAKTCNYGSEGAIECSEGIENMQYNIAVMVNSLISVSGEGDCQTYVTTNGGTWGDGATSTEVLNVEANIPLLTQYYNEQYSMWVDATFDTPCGALDLIDPTLSRTGCIACNPTYPTNDPRYCTTEGLDSNITYECITNSTIIDTFTDLAVGLGVELVTASGDSISGSFQGNFFFALMVLLVLIVAGAFAYKLFSSMNKKNKEKSPGTTDTTSSLPPQQSQTYQNSDNLQSYQSSDNTSAPPNLVLA